MINAAYNRNAMAYCLASYGGGAGCGAHRLISQLGWLIMLSIMANVSCQLKLISQYYSRQCLIGSNLRNNTARKAAAGVGGYRGVVALYSSIEKQ